MSQIGESVTVRQLQLWPHRSYGSLFDFFLNIFLFEYRMRLKLGRAKCYEAVSVESLVRPVLYSYFYF